MKNRSQVIALFIEKSGSSSHRTVKSMTILLLFRLTAPVKAFGLRSLVKPPPFNEQIHSGYKPDRKFSSLLKSNKI